MCLVLDKSSDLIVSKKSEVVDLVTEAHNLALSAAEAASSELSNEISSPKHGSTDALEDIGEDLVQVVLEKELVDNRHLLLNDQNGSFNSLDDKRLCFGELDRCLLSVLFSINESSICVFFRRSLKFSESLQCFVTCESRIRVDLNSHLGDPSLTNDAPVLGEDVCLFADLLDHDCAVFHRIVKVRFKFFLNVLDSWDNMLLNLLIQTRDRGVDVVFQMSIVEFLKLFNLRLSMRRVKFLEFVDLWLSVLLVCRKYELLNVWIDVRIVFWNDIRIVILLEMLIVKRPSALEL